MALIYGVCKVSASQFTMMLLLLAVMWSVGSVQRNLFWTRHDAKHAPPSRLMSRRLEGLVWTPLHAVMRREKRTSFLTLAFVKDKD